jgi:hypothetical protein
VNELSSGSEEMHGLGSMTALPQNHQRINLLPFIVMVDGPEEPIIARTSFV